MTARVTLSQGRAEDCPEPVLADGERLLIVTDPQGPLPRWAVGRPALVLATRRRDYAEIARHCGVPVGFLRPYATYNQGHETVYSIGDVGAKVAERMDLSRFVPDPPGWYPYGFALDLLRPVITPRTVVWDGFMGRGTIGRAVLALGAARYIGNELNPATLALARDYLAEDHHGD